MELTAHALDIRSMETDAVIVGFYEDVRPLRDGAGELDWLLCGALSKLIIEDRIRGVVGDVALLTSMGKIPASKIFLVGLGQRSGISPEVLRRAARTAAESAVGSGVVRAAMDSRMMPNELIGEGVQAIRQGLAEGAAGHPLSVDLVAADAAAGERVTAALRA